MIGVIFIAVFIFVIGFVVGIAVGSSGKNSTTFAYSQRPEDKIVNEMKRQYADNFLNRNNTSNSGCIKCGIYGHCGCWNNY